MRLVRIAVDENADEGDDRLKVHRIDTLSTLDLVRDGYSGGGLTWYSGTRGPFFTPPPLKSPRFVPVVFLGRSPSAQSLSAPIPDVRGEQQVHRAHPKHEGRNGADVNAVERMVYAPRFDLGRSPSTSKPWCSCAPMPQWTSSPMLHCTSTSVARARGKQQAHRAHRRSLSASRPQ